MALVVKATIKQKLITGVSGTGTKTILETTISSLPPKGVNEDDVAAWAAFAQTSTTLYGPDTASIQFETGNKRSNKTEKIVFSIFFVGAISRHPTLHPLGSNLSRMRGLEGRVFDSSLFYMGIPIHPRNAF
jgi:hypothetical protein